MRKRLQKDNVISQIWGSVIMSVVLSLEMPLIATGNVTLMAFCTGFLVSFFASLAMKLFTPIIDAGFFLARKVGVRPGTPGFRIAATAFQAVMMGTCMSLLMNWWGMRNVPNLADVYLQAWLRVYPFVLVSVFIMINVSIWSSGLIFRKKP